MATLVTAPTALHETTLLEPGTVYATDMPNDATKHRDHYIFSNDGPIRPNFVDIIRTKRTGLAVAIGSGAVFSLLDKHTLQSVIIDCDPTVIQIQKLVGESLTECATAQEAQEYIVENGYTSTNLRRDFICEELSFEASSSRLGDLHWIHHFDSTQEQIQQGYEPSYVIGDIRSAILRETLRTTALPHGNIELFNPTNVHNYLSKHILSMNFLRSFPFSPETLVLYSDAGTLFRRWASVGLDSYLKFANDLMRFK